MEKRKTSAKGWAACLAAIFGGIALALLQNKMTPVMDVMIKAFSIDRSTAGLLSTIFTAMGVVMALPVAGMLKKLGVRKSGFIAFGCGLIGSVLGLTASNVTVLLISRVIEGTGIGIIGVLTPSVISMWFAPENRGLPMGLWTSWMAVAQTMLFFTAAPITDSWGWQGMWVLGIVMSVIAVVLFAIFVKNPPAEENYADVEADVSIMSGLAHLPQWICALSVLCFAYCAFTFANWISSFWGETTTWGLAGANMWVGVLFASEGVSDWVAGFLCDRFHNRKLVGVASFIVYGMLGVIAFTNLSSSMILVFVVAYSLIEALVPTVLWVIAPECGRSPEYSSVAIGVFSIGLNLGTLLSAPVSGAIQQQFGWSGVGISFLVAALVGAVTLQLVKVNAPQSVA